MRIVSLLPSTTEILFGLGAGEQVVGVTFECDYPAGARSRTIVSTSAMPEGLSPTEIDAFVAEAMHRGEDLYHLDAGALSGLDADLVVTQDLCAVCAVDVSVVDDALAHLGCTAEVLTIDPHTLDEVLASVGTLGKATGTEPAATLWLPPCAVGWTRSYAGSPAVRGPAHWCSSGPTRRSRRATGCRRWSRWRAVSGARGRPARSRSAPPGTRWPRPSPRWWCARRAVTTWPDRPRSRKLWSRPAYCSGSAGVGGRRERVVRAAWAATGRRRRGAGRDPALGRDAGEPDRPSHPLEEQSRRAPRLRPPTGRPTGDGVLFCHARRTRLRADSAVTALRVTTTAWLQSSTNLL